MAPDDPELENGPACPTSTAMGEVQLILAEKRTSLATLRTGIAVEALPLSVLGLLVATSRYYDPVAVAHLLVPLLGLCLALAALGAWLMVRAIIKIRRQERLIQRIKQEYSAISHLLEG